MAAKKAKKSTTKAQRKKALLKKKLVRGIKLAKLGVKKADKKHKLAQARAHKSIKGLEKRLAAARA